MELSDNDFDMATSGRKNLPVALCHCQYWRTDGQVSLPQWLYHVKVMRFTYNQELTSPETNHIPLCLKQKIAIFHNLKNIS